MAYILVADDEERMRHLLSILLKNRGHKVDEAGDGKEALELIRNNSYDLLICDIRMPEMDGTELMDVMKGEGHTVPVIFITAFATVESAVEAMRKGAVDYITKPFDQQRILLSVEKALNVSQIMDENRELREELHKRVVERKIVWRSHTMQHVLDLCRKVAQRDSTVLITGESGTGKGVLARYIHEMSPRNSGRFVPINCAAISPNLVESELFGHEKGAFTGAIRRQRGKFEFASGGTLFMDEIGDMPLDVQAKFLKAVEEKKIRRIGGNEEIEVDVRVICATNQDLEELVQRGSFRQDLFFRINVFPIHIPPLRERQDDIIPLAEYFLRRYAGGDKVFLTDEAKEHLKRYAWPGNVRELANAMERAVIISGGGGQIGLEALGFLKSGRGCQNHSGAKGAFRLPPEGISLEELEKDLVRQALVACNFNQSAAARMLGLTRAKFRVLMSKVKRELNA